MGLGYPVSGNQAEVLLGGQPQSGVAVLVQSVLQSLGKQEARQLPSV